MAPNALPDPGMELNSSPTAVGDNRYATPTNPTHTTGESLAQVQETHAWQLTNSEYIDTLSDANMQNDSPTQIGTCEPNVVVVDDDNSPFADQAIGIHDQEPPSPCQATLSPQAQFLDGEEAGYYTYCASSGDPDEMDSSETEDTEGPAQAQLGDEEFDELVQQLKGFFNEIGVVVNQHDLEGGDKPEDGDVMMVDSNEAEIGKYTCFTG